MPATDGAVRLGFIGSGLVAERYHLPALRRVRGAEVVAACDVDPVKLERVAHRFSVPRRYSDYSRLLDDPEVDAVAVCASPVLHAEMALAALQAGKHVFLEKPPALSLGECDRLIARASERPQVVLMGFMLRWHRLLRQAAGIVRSGRLGAIHAVRSLYTSSSEHTRSERPWRRLREQGGGLLVELSIHHFDLWRFLLGTEIEEVLAMSRSAEWDDDAVSLSARLATGALAASTTSERTAPTHEHDVFGDAGRLHIDCCRADGLSFVPVSQWPGGPSTRLRKLAHAMGEFARKPFRKAGLRDSRAAYLRQWEHFVECVRAGRRPACTLEDGRAALAATLAAVESAETSRPVKVAPPPGKLGGTGNPATPMERGS